MLPLNAWGFLFIPTASEMIQRSVVRDYTKLNSEMRMFIFDDFRVSQKLESNQNLFISTHFPYLFMQRASSFSYAETHASCLRSIFDSYFMSLILHIIVICEVMELLFFFHRICNVIIIKSNHFVKTSKWGKVRVCSTPPTE